MLPDTFLMTNNLLSSYTYIICLVSGLIGFLIGRIPSKYFKRLNKNTETEG